MLIESHVVKSSKRSVEWLMRLGRLEDVNVLRGKLG